MEHWTLFWSDLADRLDGPFHLRFVLQPLMSTLFALRDGIHDARDGQPAYMWSILADKENRPDRLLQGWKSLRKVFLLALALDVVYQVLAFRWVYVFQAIFTALLLAVVPYLLLRGPINRLLQHCKRSKHIIRAAR